ncbi:zinc-dependent alcohol dehydrogenase family protein [Singulisphaera sp. PoT]|uniref:zinc-dependent alcohol dehydrogenase family protein n=1 Tax=Singulisphaera sp. PoT TaxID=3411797 RepID=UPI003BF60E32
MARVVRFHETGDPEVLKIEEIELPPPGPGEVKLGIKAIGLNRAESMYRRGQYLEDPVFPAKLGYEASGIIESVGPGVAGYEVGDAVSVVPNFSLLKYGVYGDAAIVPVTALAKHPASISWEEAAATWMQYATAYGALIEIADLKAGDTVLIPAASSSVGIAAIQIAHMVGATPVALTRTSAKRAQLEKAGATHIIATEEQDLVAETLKLTGGKGARVVFDPVGGPTVDKLCEAMCRSGILFLYGVLSTEPTPLPLFQVLAKWLTIRGYIVMEFTTNPVTLERTKAFVVEGLASGKLKPLIAKTFPLEQIVEAHRYLESNEQIGKVVVTV